jgi:hypothetical protein
VPVAPNDSTSGWAGHGARAMSLRAVADALKAGALNARGARWQPQTVANVLART